jgi:hypothetical protein
MLEKKDCRALLWSGVALVGAACLGHEALAGNVVEAYPPGTFAYFSANLQVQTQFLTNGSGYQLLIDDVTYAPTFAAMADFATNILPSPSVWMGTMGQMPWAGYEIAGGYPAGWTSFTTVGAPGTLNSGYSIVFDTSVWAYCAGFDYATRLTEVTPGVPPTVVDRFDESSTVFHATMLGRHTVVNGNLATANAAATGLGISEALSTVSESRHFHTPVLIAPGNEIHANFRYLPPVLPVGGAYVFTVYIKGRVNYGAPLNDVGALFPPQTGP